MRNSIISFNYLGALFSAKVLLKKSSNITLQTIIMMDAEDPFMPEINPLILMQTGLDNELVLLHDNGTVEALSWKIKGESDESVAMVNLTAFCLS